MTKNTNIQWGLGARDTINILAFCVACVGNPSIQRSESGLRQPGKQINERGLS
jgi:hypothetical protein